MNWRGCMIRFGLGMMGFTEMDGPPNLRACGKFIIASLFQSLNNNIPIGILSNQSI